VKCSFPCVALCVCVCVCECDIFLNYIYILGNIYMSKTKLTVNKIELVHLDR